MRSLATFTFPWLGALGMFAALTATSACGDVDTFNFRTGPVGANEPLIDLESAFVQLARVTTRCADGVPDTLVAMVDDQMEFPGDEVATLKSSCVNGSAVNIDLQGRSIIYDFSQVISPDLFSPADFNGYVFTDVWGLAPEILEARLDREASTLNLADDDIVAEGGTVRINLQGQSFDETTFVKIDLAFAEVNVP